MVGALVRAGGPKNFRVPLSSYFSLFRSAAHPNSQSSDQYKLDIIGEDGKDPTVLDPEQGDTPIIAVIKRMARGEHVSNEEAHELLEPIDSIVIGDPDHCTAKLDGYRRIGADRMMCMMQFGRIAHDAVMNSIRLTAEHHLHAYG